MPGKTREFFLICNDCGNIVEFEREVYGSCRITRNETYNAETDLLEESDTETEDEEFEGEDEWICINCGSQNIEECDDQEEIDQIIWEYTTKEGTWSKKELDIKDRDPELGKKVVINNL